MKQQQEENKTETKPSIPVKRTGFFQRINQEAALGGAGELSQETEAASD